LKEKEKKGSKPSSSSETLQTDAYASRHSLSSPEGGRRRKKKEEKKE